jgi:hypothetical protein
MDDSTKIKMTIIIGNLILAGLIAIVVAITIGTMNGNNNRQKSIQFVYRTWMGDSGSCIFQSNRGS